jgi:Domain of unknown function (DU1801)
MDNSQGVNEYIASLDQRTAEDSRTLLEMMQRISRSEPKIWNVGTIGFDSYHFKYKSGREGDCHILGFYPRKSKTTVYLMDGTERYAELLGDLGTYTKTGYCLYIKRLCDVKLEILEKILQESYDNIKSLDGHITQILWKSG